MYTKQQQEALHRANSILLSLNAFLGDILSRKYGKKFSELEINQKAMVISQTVCMYIADHIKNDGLANNKELVEKHQNLYVVKYQHVINLSEDDEQKYREKEQEAMNILLASLSDSNVKEIQSMLPIQGIVEFSDTVDTVVLKMLELEVPENVEN